MKDDFLYRINRIAFVCKEMNYSIKRNKIWLEFLSNKKITEQGWKIHVSSSVFEFLQTLENIFPILIREGVSFKIPSTWHSMISLTTGGTPYESSAKMVTIYPENDRQFASIVEQLRSVLTNTNFPQIFTDFQVGEQNIFVRYGSFRENYLRDDRGFLELAVYRNDGNLKRDERELFPRITSEVDIPLNSDYFLKYNEPNSETIPIKAKKIELLQRSVKGNVYKVLSEGNRFLILKEGFNTGVLDTNGGSAATRLLNEANMLQMLKLQKHVPNLLKVFTTNNSFFLLEEFMSGIPLDLIFKSGLYSRVIFRKFIKKVVMNLYKIISNLHNLNVVIRDLSPNNILVDEFGNVNLIDFELASFDGNPMVYLGATPGFFPEYESLSALRNRFCYDWYAFGAILYFVTTSIKPIFNEACDQYKKSSYFEKLKTICDLTIKDGKMRNIALAGIEIMKNYNSMTKQRVYNLIVKNNTHKGSRCYCYEGSSGNHDQLIQIEESIKKTIHRQLSFFDFNKKANILVNHGSSESQQSGLLSLNTGIPGYMLLYCTYLINHKDDMVLDCVRNLSVWLREHFSNLSETSPTNFVNGYSSLLYTLGLLTTLDPGHSSEYEDLQYIIAVEIEKKLSKNVYNGILYGISGIGLMAVLPLKKFDLNQRNLCILRKIVQRALEIIYSRSTFEGTQWRIEIKDCEGVGDDQSQVLDFGYGIAGIATFLLLGEEDKTNLDFLNAGKSVLEQINSNLIICGKKERGVSQINGAGKSFPFLFSGTAGINIFLSIYNKTYSSELAGLTLKRLMQSLKNDENHFNATVINGESGILIGELYSDLNDMEELNRRVRLIYALSSQRIDKSIYWTVPGKFDLFSDSFLNGSVGDLLALILGCDKLKRGQRDDYLEVRQ